MDIFAAWCRYGAAMTSAPLGRLTSVPARQIWPDEARHFTPWLLDNAEVLAEVLGFPIELKYAEHPVGTFRLDLIGHVAGTEEVVIVENQLEVSDHTHLGQILTYAGGTDPTNIVWVAPRFTEEHRAALDWLNARTDQHTRFFAVEVKLVSIGDSVPAPLLSLVVKPNDWEKQVKAASASAKNAWTRSDFAAAMPEYLSDDQVSKVEALIGAHEAAGASSFWGVGAVPSFTPLFRVGGLSVQPWTLFLSGRRLAINWDWIHKSGEAAGPDAMERFADRLAVFEGVAALASEARAVGWRRRPSIPAATVLDSPNGVDQLTAAVTEVIGTIQA